VCTDGPAPHPRLTHSGEKAYKCNICNKAFHQVRGLPGHFHFLKFFKLNSFFAAILLAIVVIIVTRVLFLSLKFQSSASSVYGLRFFVFLLGQRPARTFSSINF
jgi:hypothetical protein